MTTAVEEAQNREDSRARASQGEIEEGLDQIRRIFEGNPVGISGRVPNTTELGVFGFPSLSDDWIRGRPGPGAGSWAGVPFYAEQGTSAFDAALRLMTARSDNQGAPDDFTPPEGYPAYEGDPNDWGALLEYQLGAYEHNRGQRTLADYLSAAEAGVDRNWSWRATPASEGFDEDFYRQASQSQLDYGIPEIERQYADALGIGRTGTARAGLGRSSVANRLEGRLAGQNLEAIGQLEDVASRRETDLKGAVEDARRAVEGQLYVTGDAAHASSSARRSVDSLSSIAPAEVLGPIFEDTLNTFGSYYNPIARANTAWGRRPFNRSTTPGFSSGGAPVVR